MAKLEWGRESVASGVQDGFIFVTPNEAYAWNGLIKVTKIPDLEATPYYSSGYKSYDYATLEDISLTVESFTYPEVLDQEKKISAFGFRSKIDDKHVEVNIYYNVLFLISEVSYETVNDSMDIINFSHTGTTVPVYLKRYAPTSHLKFVYSLEDSWFFQFLQDYIFGNDSSDPKLPTIPELIEWFTEQASNYTLLIVDYGNGIWSAIGPDNMVYMTSDTEFEIDSPTVTYLDPETYTVHSY